MNGLRPNQMNGFRANQMNDFYMRGTLVIKESSDSSFSCLLTPLLEKSVISLYDKER